MALAKPRTTAPKSDLLDTLSRREREIMDIIYRRGPSTAIQVMENLSRPPSYSAVRALLRILEQKGRLRHVHDGVRYVYLPTLHQDKARSSALQHVLRTFFDNSAEKMVATLLDSSTPTMSDEELERLARLIEDAREEGQ